MTKQQATIIIVFAVVVLAGVVIGTMTRNGAAPVSPVNQSNGIAATPTPKDGGKSGFTSEVPRNAEPTKPSQNIPIQNQPAGSIISNYKIFNVNVTGSGYIPSEITVNNGDVVEINLSASGGSFDLFSQSAGFYISAASGKTGKITFTPSTPGTYSFACRDMCPSGKTISGELIVLP